MDSGRHGVSMVHTDFGASAAARVDFGASAASRVSYFHSKQGQAMTPLSLAETGYVSVLDVTWQDTYHLMHLHCAFHWSFWMIKAHGYKGCQP